MLDILTRAGCFVAIIILGFILRRTKFFGPEAFSVLSNVVMKITLPAALIANSAGRFIDTSMLSISLIGFGCGVLYIFLGWLILRRGSREYRAQCILNLPGYNIGLFAMPFTSSFLGPVGVLTTSLFDLGNAFICNGGSYAIARAVKDGGKTDFLRVLKAPFSSIPFLAHCFTILLNLLNVTLPRPVLSLAEIISGANAFLAMLMIGVGLGASTGTGKLSTVIKILSLRFSVAVLLALAFFHLLPFSLEIRQALVILAFSPLTSTSPFYTAELKEDVGLASAINSISIVISIIIVVTLLIVML